MRITNAVFVIITGLMMACGDGKSEATGTRKSSDPEWLEGYRNAICFCIKQDVLYGSSSSDPYCDSIAKDFEKRHKELSKNEIKEIFSYAETCRSEAQEEVAEENAELGFADASSKEEFIKNCQQTLRDGLTADSSGVTQQINDILDDVDDYCECAGSALENAGVRFDEISSKSDMELYELLAECNKRMAEIMDKAGILSE